MITSERKVMLELEAIADDTEREQAIGIAYFRSQITWTQAAYLYGSHDLTFDERESIASQLIEGDK